MARLTRSDARRPHGDGGCLTGERLLEVAERLFARSGFDATSVRRITAGAGCNLAAVNYHFGSKQQLYESVFRRHFATLRHQRVESVERTMAAGADLEAVLVAFGEAFLEPWVRDSEGRVLIELMDREMADPRLPADLFRREIADPVQAILVRAITTAEPSLSASEAGMCALSIIGQLVHIAHRLRRAEGVGRHHWPAARAPEAVAHIARFSACAVHGFAAGNPGDRRNRSTKRQRLLWAPANRQVKRTSP
jgi:AcrR family transcriptional regulator